MIDSIQSSLAGISKISVKATGGSSDGVATDFKYPSKKKTEYGVLVNSALIFLATATHPLVQIGNSSYHTFGCQYPSTISVTECRLGRKQISIREARKLSLEILNQADKQRRERALLQAQRETLFYSC